MTRPRHDGTVALDTSFFETRMAALGLKQYWLAEQLGVHPRTVLRWANGQVRRIQREHLAALAVHLQCREDELSPREVDDDPRIEAARALVDDDIFALLTPSASYPLVEKLIAATLDAALTLHTRGKLLVILALAVGRQFRRDDAIAHAEAAAEIGRGLGNRVIVARAGYAEAWARLYAGEVAAARAAFQRAVDELDYLGEPADAAMAWFGLGSCQGFAHEHDVGIASLGEAIVRLEPLERPIDLSMPLYVRGVMLTDVGRYDEAIAELERSRALASGIGWRAGIGRATAALADAIARRGDVATGIARYEEALAILRDDSFIHPAVFIAGASIFKLAGNLDRARAEIARGLPMADMFVAERDALLRMRDELG
ncbi:MAG TPA: helix-turn-helix transcriptional regulator [Nannocystaceae bacterium]|nr:helix-turn-helix transcriptional regulator [Nannocystaceae bacterium]